MINLIRSLMRKEMMIDDDEMNYFTLLLTHQSMLTFFPADSIAESCT